MPKHGRRLLCLVSGALLASLAAGAAYSQDAARLVDQTLTGTSPNGEDWAAYYAPDGTLYSWNSSTGERFVEAYTIEDDQLCYTGQGCWEVRIDGDQVTVVSREPGLSTLWTMQPGDPLDLVTKSNDACRHSHDGSQCL